MYQPTDDDIAWTKNFLALASEKAVWGVPANGCTYEIHKAAKEIHLIKGNENNEMHEMIKAVFKKVGYKMVD